jgi:D-alanine-D-alanine ligase
VKIAVFFGGESMERDVSAASAAQVVAALRSRGHDVVAADTRSGILTHEAERELLTGRIDRTPPRASVERNWTAFVEVIQQLAGVDIVFLALHGGSGENGTLQSVLDFAGVPYTGSGRLGSALAWDKDIAKRVFQAAGVPTPEWVMAPADAAPLDVPMSYPVVVKPSGQGSTVGLTLVRSAHELPAAVAEARRFDAEVMIERYIDGRELTVGILGGEPLAVGEILSATGPIFDYAAKYQAGGAEEIFPADLSTDQTHRIQTLGLRAHEALKLDDYSRVDFRMDRDGGLWCLEVNTLPGLSASSLLPRSAAAVGIDFAELCERICAAARARRPASSR